MVNWAASNNLQTTKKSTSMKQVHALLLSAVLFLTITSCDDNVLLESNCRQVKVEFFLDHPDMRVIPAEFDTIIETVLTKDGYRMDGATFETVTESVLVREAYKRYNIMEKDSIKIISDTKNSVATVVPCMTFFETPEEICVPDDFTTITSQRLAMDGIGEFVEPQFIERVYYKLKSQARVETRNEDEERRVMTIEFELIESADIDGYLQEEAGECLAGRNYRVLQ